MITIRSYTSADWKMIKEWWHLSGEVGPFESMMPLDSSFVAELDGSPALAVALYLTNMPEAAFVENFIGNPEVKGEKRKEASQLLADHIARFAKQRGYKCLVCMTEKDVLKKRYVELGFNPTLSGVTTFVRVV